MDNAVGYVNWEACDTCVYQEKLDEDSEEECTAELFTIDNNMLYCLNYRNNRNFKC